MEHSALLRSVGEKGLPPSEVIPGHVGCSNGEMKRDGGTCPGTLTEQLWSSTDALPLLERDDLLGLKMLDVVERGPLTPPVPAERALSSEPREKSQSVYLPPMNCPFQSLKELHIQEN